MLDDTRHRLEETDVVFARGGLGLHRPQLRKEARKLVPPRGIEILDQAGNDAAGAQRVHPGAERQDLLVFVGAAEQDLAPRVRRLGDQRFHQPRLADADLAVEDPDRPMAPRRVRQPLAKRRVLRNPSDQGGVGGEDGGAEATWLHVVADVRPRLEEIAIELPGLRLGLDAELALEDADAGLVLAERRASPVLSRVEAHQRPMHGLLGRLEPEQPYRGLDGVLHGVGSRVVGEQLREALDGQLPESLSLGSKPFLEGGLGDAHTLEQVAAVERRRPFQRFGAGRRRQRFEPRDVHLDRRRADADVVALLDEARSRGTRQGLTQRHEGLPETVARALVGRVAPQKRRQLVARDHPSGLEREIGEERLGLLAWKGDG